MIVYINVHAFLLLLLLFYIILFHLFMTNLNKFDKMACVLIFIYPTFICFTVDCETASQRDQRGYSEISEIYYRLRFIFFPIFNMFGPI